MKFGIVADDNTGATDAAGMLTEAGISTVFLVGTPGYNSNPETIESFDAAVIGTCSRSISLHDADILTSGAFRFLKQSGAEKFQLKYCSTFDSTKKGNIGISLDAALKELGTNRTIVAPALPVNGRTTYLGYHFVNGVPLNESPMRNHPLNPMTDANLVRWLQYQTEKKVALAPLNIIRKGSWALKRHLNQKVRNGASYIVTDATEQQDLEIIAEATEKWPLLSGGSGITAAIPRQLFKRRRNLDFSERLQKYSRQTLVVAGSCSEATRAQNKLASRHGFKLFVVDSLKILDRSFSVERFRKRIVKHLKTGGNAIIASSATPETIEKVHSALVETKISPEIFGELVAGTLSEIISSVFDYVMPGRMVVSGGETSGAICQRLGISMMETGLPIAPGVPYCFPLHGPDVLTILKSGNFGGEDFYLQARDLG